MNYYTVKDIAELLSVNEETVRRWIREGKLVAEGLKKYEYKVIN